MNVYDVFADKHHPVAGLEEARQLVYRLFKQSFPESKTATLDYMLAYYCVTDDCFDCICDRIRDHVTERN